MNTHSKEIDEVIKQFESSKTWLSINKASEFLQKFWSNTLPKGKKRSIFSMIWEQLKSTLILVLLIAALVSVWLEKSYIDAIIILLIVIINTVIWVMQEYKTEETLSHLKKLLTTHAIVLREGKMYKIRSEEVVPGDILIIEEWEKIVADARIIESQWLKVNQSILTGESVVQEKSSHSISDSTPLTDRINMVYQGTSATSGSCRAIVVATGEKTELWNISKMVNNIVEEINPFSQKLEDFSKKISIFILIICIFVVAILLLEGSTFSSAFLMATSLAVWAIPEGLPAVVALGLAFSTKRLVKKNVLVRKLPASETLGRVTVICTDKTGTLTQSEMKIVDIYQNGIFHINTSETQIKNNNISIFDIATLCNKANRAGDSDRDQKCFYWDPTEVGLLECASLYWFEKEEREKRYTLVKEFPFDSERKRMSIIRVWENWLISFVKWAPERIIELTKYEEVNGWIIEISKERKDELQEVYIKLASEGKRVLAFWYKNFDIQSKKEDIKIDDAESELVFVGFMAMIDPPRPEVADSIKTCLEAGIRVIMITWDSELTAKAIASNIGLWNKSIDATQLSKLTDEELKEKLSYIDVFSRIAPQDKLRIVSILKSEWHIVAMTWDGVNDALALKKSDIWVSMGKRWTDVARDASDMVLLDDNFASIVSGVEEGRRIYDNTKKFIKYLLACNFYEVILLALCVIIFRDVNIVPFLAIQILWINLVTDSFPALALSSQETECDVMKRKPVNESLISGIQWFIIWSGIIWLCVVGTIFIIFRDNLPLAQTLAVTTSVVYQMLRAISCGRNQPFDFGVNKWLYLAIGFSLLLHFWLLASPISQVFKFVSLSQLQLHHYYWIFWLSSVWYFLGELSKIQFRKIHN